MNDKVIMYVARWYRVKKFLKVATHTRWFTSLEEIIEYKKGFDSAKSCLSDGIVLETYKCIFEKFSLGKE